MTWGASRVATEWHRLARAARGIAGFDAKTRGARRLQSLAVVSVTACMHWYWRPELNPYRVEQAIVVVLLVAGLAGWRRWRPTPSWFAGRCIMFASIVTGCAVFTMVSDDWTPPAGVCRAVLHSSMVLTGLVYLEVSRAWRAQRRPIAEATARYQVAASRRNSSE